MRDGIVKHATSSVFVFGYDSQGQQPSGWRLGLIMHPVHRRPMIPGGHVEAGETQEETALREVAEETGLRVRLASPPQPPVPDGLAGVWVAQPWWIVEHPVPSDNQLDQRHIHVDHLYVAVADQVVALPAELPFRWHAAGDLAGLDMFEDTRVLAGTLFGQIGDLAWAGSAD